MKKVLLSLSLLFTTPLFAEVTAYIGLGVHGGNGIQNREYLDGSVFDTEYTLGAGVFKLGSIDKDNDRVEVVFTSLVASAQTGSFAQNTSGDNNVSSYTGIDINGVWTLGKNKSFAPFLGLGFGIYSNNSIDGVNQNTGEVESAGGLSLNASLGLMVAFGELLELEVAVNSKAIGWNLEDPVIGESIKSAYLGVNFRF